MVLLAGDGMKRRGSGDDQVPAILVGLAGLLVYICIAIGPEVSGGMLLVLVLPIVMAGAALIIYMIKKRFGGELEAAVQHAIQYASAAYFPGRTKKRWTVLVVSALCIFVCHLGVLLGFMPGILRAFPAAAALPAASLVSWGLLAVLLMRYRTYHYPISQKIENLTRGAAPFFLPKSMLTVYREMQTIEGSIQGIREKNKATGDYIRLLKKNPGDPAAKSLLNKYKEYSEFFNNHYADCCSAYLNKRFQFYIILIKEILLPGNKIHTLDIEGFIDSIKGDLNSARYMLTDKAYPGGTGAAKITKPPEPKKPPASDKPDKDGDMADDTAFDIVSDSIAETMAALKKEISRLTVYLITVQSSKTIAGASPIDGKSFLDMYREYNLGMNFTTDIEYLRRLEDEFDRFMAEKELSAR
jgi:hypothetical protein